MVMKQDSEHERGFAVSVIICTRNNADSLAKTLAAFTQIAKGIKLAFELIVVDNGSSDGTSGVVERCAGIPDLVYIQEPEVGLSHARNAGLGVTRGEAILFTDDDVMPCADWVEKMARPLLTRQCDSVTGKVQLAAHLRRPWMQPMHYLWLAASRTVLPELVGACMGFHRSVLQKVPGFDPDLGAGALGFCEETLFSHQLDVAGYSRCVIDDPCVEHHPQPSRLVRREWLAAARRRGRSTAYVLHHWEHRSERFPLLRGCYYQLKLALRRIIQPPPGLDEEGAPAWELSYLVEIEKCRALRVERKRPRRYGVKGLRKNQP